MLYIALLLVFISGYLLNMGIFSIVFQDRLLMSSRLAQLNKVEQTGLGLRDELQQPLWKRIGKPLLVKVGRLFTYRMNSDQRDKLNKRLQAAGNPWGLDPGGFRLLQVIVTAIAVGLVILLRRNGSGNILLLLFTAIICGILLPEMLLSRRINERRQKIVRSLPDVLDLLTVSVEAGLGFDLALVRVTERFPGALAQELSSALQEMRLGRSRREALQDMSDRVGAEDLSNFISSLVQADKLGVGLGNILRLQSDEVRRKRRQRAEEQAMKAPVKMLLPLVFFIFPALFVVLLGPALIQIFRQL
ncbi:MAG: type II secretion system F family protein [Syntrophaceticus sp.]